MSEVSILYEIIKNNNSELLGEIAPDYFLNPYNRKLAIFVNDVVMNNNDMNVKNIKSKISQSNEKDIIKNGLFNLLDKIDNDILIFDKYMIDDLKENYMQFNIKKYLTDIIKKLGNNYFSLDALSQLDILNDNLSNMREITPPINYNTYKKEYTNKILNNEIEQIEIAKLKHHVFTDIFGNGIIQGQLIIIGGRPSMGKTVLTDNLMLDLADNGSGVCYFSLENKTDLTCRKLIAMDSNISTYHTRIADLEEWAVAKIKNTEQNKKIYIFDKNFDINQIKTHAIKLMKLYNIKIVVIDYMQKVPPIANAGLSSEYLQLNYACRVIQELTALGLTVILLSQSNDRKEKTKDNYLTFGLGDLKGSGTLEADADIVIGIEGVRSEQTRILNKLKDRNSGLAIYEVEFDFTTGRIL